MPKVSAKRQITLPVTECEALGIQAGDEVDIFCYGNQINIIKKQRGSAAGLLKDTAVKEKKRRYSDKDSLMSHFE